MSEGQVAAAPAAPAAVSPDAGLPGGRPAPESPSNWGTLSPELQSFVAGKGWKDVGTVVGSYQNLEKTLGNSVRIPGEDAKPEDVAKFWSKVGRPENEAGYKLDNYQPAEGTLDLIPWFKGVALKNNLPAKAFEGVAGEFVKHMEEVGRQEQEAYTAQVQTQMDAVVKEWGPEAAVHQRNIQLFRQAFGLSTEQTTEMMLAIGPQSWAKFASKAGSYFAEAKVGGDLPGGGSQFGMTREAAAAQLSELTADSAFAKRYANEDRVAVNQVNRLRKIASGQT